MQMLLADALIFRLRRQSSEPKTDSNCCNQCGGYPIPILPDEIYDTVLSFADGPAEIFRAGLLPGRGFLGSEKWLLHSQWEHAYQSRFPAFYEALAFSGECQWHECWRGTISGQVEVLVDIFDREKKPGFAMSAMPAQCRWDHERRSFVARYLSVSQVPEEVIPLKEGNRLRFCPENARDQIQAKDRRAIDPFKILYQPLNTQDVHLLPGQAVELQWKMRGGGPFGWWYCEVESAEPLLASGQYSATLKFRHFPETSPWYRLTVPLGMDSPSSCAIGGYSGGLRRCTEREKRHWMTFFPEQPVVV